MSQKKLITELTNNNQQFKYFYILTAIYIAGMMTSLTVSARLFPFQIPFTHMTILLTGGTWTIPLSFFIQDISTEVYGYAKSAKLIKITLIILVFYIVYTKLITFLPTPGIANIDQAYNTVFNALPRHLFALLAAIAVGNLTNNYIISKLKIRFKGKHLAFRFIFATTIGEALLQIVGTSVAWLGSLHFTSDILPFVVFSYLYKIVFEAAMTPFNIMICEKLKKSEGVDIYDKNIDYNPFTVKSQVKEKL
jgi:queuosine precursor transporter